MAWADAVWLKNKIITKLTDINTGLINKLNSNESNIKTAITNTQTAIINNDNTNKNALSTKVDNVKSVVDTTKTNVDSIKTTTDTTKTNLTSLTDKVTTLTNTVNTINTSVNNVKNEVNTVKTEVTEVKQSVGITSVDTDISRIFLNDNDDRTTGYVYMFKPSHRNFYDKNFNKITMQYSSIIEEDNNGNHECISELDYGGGISFNGNSFTIGESNPTDVKKIHIIGYDPSNVSIYKKTYMRSNIIGPDETSAEYCASFPSFDSYEGPNNIIFQYNQLVPKKCTLCICVYAIMPSNPNESYSGTFNIKSRIFNISNNVSADLPDIHLYSYGSNYVTRKIQGVDQLLRENLFIGECVIPSQYCNSNYKLRVTLHVSRFVVDYVAGEYPILANTTYNSSIITE